MRSSATLSFTRLCVLCTLMLLSGITIFCLTAQAQSSATDIADSVLHTLAALEDRSTGQSGAHATADLIAQHFSSAHQQIQQDQGRSSTMGKQSFLVPVMQYGTSTLSVQGKTVPLFPLRMNALSSGSIASPGIRAPVVYAGKGSLHEMNGLEIEGALVLMDSDSGTHWQNAALLGARALIYVENTAAGHQSEPGRGNSSFLRDKFELTPVDFPRFWLPLSKARALFGPLSALGRTDTARQATVVCEAQWENVVAQNLWLLIEGSGAPETNTPADTPEALTNEDNTPAPLNNELVLIESFYDATGYVAGAAPGVEQAVSLDTLLAAAQYFARNPPERSVLLVATGAHSQGMAGMRELIWALTEKKQHIQALHTKQADRAHRAEHIQSLLTRYTSTTPASLSKKELRLLREAVAEVVKGRLDTLSTTLTGLRLEKGPNNPDRADRIASLARQRLKLRKLEWFPEPHLQTKEQKALLETLLPAIRTRQRTILADASTQRDSLQSGLMLRQAVHDRPVAASVSLHLSSHGQGIGAFERGFAYEFRQHINRTRRFSDINELLEKTAHARTARSQAAPVSSVLSSSSSSVILHDTLRPDAQNAWQGYLPDKPHFSGEVAALAGLPGFTLATVHDARPLWGTPFDTLDKINTASLQQQKDFVLSLLSALTHGDTGELHDTLATDFTTLTGRANLLRQGALFPDKPATDSVYLCFQGNKRLYAMVDTAGELVVKGLAHYAASPHKAVLEGFRFSPETGRALWAVDKPRTGKAAYRVRMKRARVDTDLVMFACTQTSLFNLFTPRTFAPMIRTQLIDARTESEPLKYWYSRLDTRISTLGTFFVAPGTPLKITLSDTLLDKKMILLNSNADSPQGTGYQVEHWPRITATAYQAARDMWSLLGPRIQALEERGIVSETLQQTHQQGLNALHAAARSEQLRQWDAFMTQARTSLALAGQVYNAVNSTQKDVLAGVLFYIALFVPFAYCLERVLFGFADIHKRLMAFSGLLVAVITAVYFVHPAFELTYSPLVVVLAFFILGLSALVSFIIFSRFEREMAQLQRRAKHLKASGISKSAAFGAAFALGVSNLRRRPLRTVLTCLTLTILTFTIMNFTAVQSQREHGWVHFSDRASYDGLLLKNPGWQDLPPAALTVFEDMLSSLPLAADKKPLLAPRLWYATKDTTRAPVVPIQRGTRQALVRGIVGLSYTEPAVSHMDTGLISGRWFTRDEPRGIILSRFLAASLGIEPDDIQPDGIQPDVSGRTSGDDTPGQLAGQLAGQASGSAPANQIRLWGEQFTVTGILADKALETRPDLDGEPVTPVIYPSEAANRLSETELEAIEEGRDVVQFHSRYQHIRADQTIILPYPTLLAMAGSNARLKALSLSALPATQEKTSARRVRELGDRFGLLLFQGQPQPTLQTQQAGTSLFYAVNATAYTGLSSIAIPLLISLLIVLGTMTGSVFERKGEIGIYTSIGLAPSHVAFLFVAEALAFAVISVVLGYLLAQLVAVSLSGTSLWQGMTANYSSLAAVLAMLLVIAVVLVSAVYPARLAAQIAIPDVNRSWVMPAPEGNTVRLDLPFLVNLHEQASAGGFLQQYYNAHHDVSHGLFCTDDMHCQYLPQEALPAGAKALFPSEVRCLGMDLLVWLAPFDFGVRQEVSLVFCPCEQYPGFLQIHVTMIRQTGEQTAWIHASKRFLNDLRKQLLVWRSLDEPALQQYSQTLQTENNESILRGLHDTAAPATPARQTRQKEHV